jgi:hypothetical protein
MALSGVHVACCPVYNLNNASLIGAPDWSQTMASGGTTTNTVPGGGSRVFVVRATADIYVAIGQAPDASQTTGLGDSARIAIDAGTTQTIVCASGQKLAWVAA